MAGTRQLGRTRDTAVATYSPGQNLEKLSIMYSRLGLNSSGRFVNLRS